MIRSMTGYGKTEVAAATGRITVEIRSVNHRYGEIFIKLPRAWLFLENDVRKAVAARLKRGKVEVFIQHQPVEGAVAPPAVNLPLAKAYQESFTRLRDHLGLTDPVTLPLILAQKDVITSVEREVADEVGAAELLAAVGIAVDNIDAMRLREGMALLDDIRERREKLAAVIDEIAVKAPQVSQDYAARLRERVAQLAGDGNVDEWRLTQEIAIMADRSDITEELVRFNSHLQQFAETLSHADAVGRKLDFILQEMNREVNTIGSKANDAVIAGHVVAMKSELEKIREQVQNIE